MAVAVALAEAVGNQCTAVAVVAAGSGVLAVGLEEDSQYIVVVKVRCQSRWVGGLGHWAVAGLAESWRTIVARTEAGQAEHYSLHQGMS